MSQTAEKSAKKVVKKKAPTKVTKKAAPKKAPTKVTKKAAPTKAAPTKAAPKKAPAKKKGGVVTHVSRSPEQAFQEEHGDSFHGAALSHGDLKKPNKVGILTYLALDQLQLPEGLNPRGNPGPIDELAASIKSGGVLSSLVVRPSKTTGKFDIIAGERRFRACTAINYDQPIPCIIRSDLIGDDAAALAVALAENGEDGRNNLNMIEIGRACKQLESKHGWSVSRIAKATSLHIQRVRRALALVETPNEVQANIEEGKWSVAAALEYARLPDATREAVKDKIQQATTADDIRKLRKAAERDAAAQAAAKGQPVQKVTKAGKPSKSSPLRIYRQSKAKVAALQELCHAIQTAEKDEVGSTDYHELLGAIAWALWDRGDRSTFYAPVLEPEKGSPDYAEQMKDLTGFWAAIKAEAAKYTPDEDGEADPE